VVQAIGVQTGFGLGIAIIQCSQVITVLGGPAGYLLACNSFAAEVVEPSERTATLGRLTGCSLFGTSAGFLLGGLISDHFGIVAPFRVAVLLFLASVVYAAVFLPHVPLNKEIEAKASTSFKAFFDPLKIFIPQKWRLPNGKVQREYGTLLVGIGVFLGVFATGYIPVLLQMYATDAFGFTPNENGWLISVNCLVRGLFLTLAFPEIISRGRKWLDRRNQSKEPAPSHLKGSDYLPSSPAHLASVPGVNNDETEPIDPPPPSTEAETYAFDLFYIKLSLVMDGILTAGATFTNQGWQMYVVAVAIPLAAGSGTSAKGTILQMCEPQHRADALGAISLVEMMARLSTSKLPFHLNSYTRCADYVLAGLFGLIFSAFAAIGKPHYTFALNGVSSLIWFDVYGVSLTQFPGCRTSSIHRSALRAIPSRGRYKIQRRCRKRRLCVELRSSRLVRSDHPRHSDTLDYTRSPQTFLVWR
jgi:MFS family permease